MLKKDSEGELKNCVKVQAPCRITGEFAATVRDVIEFTKNLDNYIKTLPKNISLNFLKSETSLISEVIDVKITKPVNECIKFGLK